MAGPIEGTDGEGDKLDAYVLLPIPRHTHPSKSKSKSKSKTETSEAKLLALAAFFERHHPYHAMLPREPVAGAYMH